MQPLEDYFFTFTNTGSYNMNFDSMDIFSNKHIHFGLITLTIFFTL